MDRLVGKAPHADERYDNLADGIIVAGGALLLLAAYAYLRWAY